MKYLLYPFAGLLGLLAATLAAPVAEAQTIVTVASGLNRPEGIALDGEGNLVVADSYNNQVLQFQASSSYATRTPLAGTLSSPTAAATDPQGNLFILSASGGVVTEFSAGGGYHTPKSLVTGVPATSIAVDAKDNIFLASATEIYEIPTAASSQAPVVLAKGFSKLTSIAVDAGSNLFVTDYGAGQVEEIAASGGYASVTPIGAGIVQPYALAVDGTGNVLVLQSGPPYV